MHKTLGAAHSRIWGLVKADCLQSFSCKQEFATQSFCYGDNGVGCCTSSMERTVMVNKKQSDALENSQSETTNETASESAETLKPETSAKSASSKPAARRASSSKPVQNEPGAAKPKTRAAAKDAAIGQASDSLSSEVEPQTSAPASNRKTSNGGRNASAKSKAGT